METSPIRYDAVPEPDHCISYDTVILGSNTIYTLHFGRGLI